MLNRVIRPDEVIDKEFSGGRSPIHQAALELQIFKLYSRKESSFFR